MKYKFNAARWNKDFDTKAAKDAFYIVEGQIEDGTLFGKIIESNYAGAVVGEEDEFFPKYFDEI